jgi:hypothetical protein
MSLGCGSMGYQLFHLSRHDDQDDSVGPIYHSECVSIECRGSFYGLFPVPQLCHVTDSQLS